jgi:hypothetical protein
VEFADDAGDGRGEVNDGLVGLDLGEDLVFGHAVAGVDVPGDEFALGDALAHVGELELEHQNSTASRMPSLIRAGSGR